MRWRPLGSQSSQRTWTPVIPLTSHTSTDARGWIWSTSSILGGIAVWLLLSEGIDVRLPPWRGLRESAVLDEVKHLRAGDREIMVHLVVVVQGVEIVIAVLHP